MSKNKMLVIAAHPDDEVLGCGATIAKKAKAGFEVNILILGEGATSRGSVRDSEGAQEELAGLQIQARNAAKILGASSVEFGGLPDNRFDSVDLLDVVKIVEKFKNKFKPDLVFTHHEGDLNIDHKITFQAVLTAFRPLPHDNPVSIYSFEVGSSTEWQSPNGSVVFRPQYFEDIGSFIDKKIDAMSVYQGELREFPHPRSIDGIKAYAQRRGIAVGKIYAEAFEVIRMMS